MKHFKLILVIITAAAFLLLSSCSDDTAATDPTDTNTNPTEGLYFPLTQSSEWECDKYTLNMDGTINADTKKAVNIKVAGIKKYGGIDYAGVLTQENSIETSKHYYYSDGDKLYVNKEAVEPNYDELDLSMFMDELPETIVIADFNTNEWTLLEDEVENFDLGLELEGMAVTLSGDIKLVCKKGSFEKVTLADFTEVDAQEFTMEYSFVGLALGLMPVEFGITVHRWYAADMGLVLEVMDSETIEVEILPDGMPIKGYKIVAKTISIAE